MHLHSDKIPKGLYVCDHCSHYHMIGESKKTIVTFTLLTAFVLIIGNINDLGVRALLIFFAYFILREGIKLAFLESNYPIMKYFDGDFEPTEAQHKGVNRREMKQEIASCTSLFMIPYLPE